VEEHLHLLVVHQKTTTVETSCLLHPNSSVAKLAIAVESATDLPARDYSAHCDPWVSVTVLRDRISIRRHPPAPIAFFRTKTIRHAHNPFYSQTFITDIQRKEMKVLVSVFIHRQILSTFALGYFPHTDRDGPGQALRGGGDGPHHHHAQRCQADSGGSSQVFHCTFY
jgi:hypothetical protein